MFKHEMIDTNPINLCRVDVDGQRHYKVPSGKLYKSVTTVLGSIHKEHIEMWKQAVGEEAAALIAAKASRRGTIVHHMCECLLLNKPINTDDRGKMLMPIHVEMFSELKAFIENNVDSVMGVELRMFSDELELAGTVDCLCVLNGVRTVVDFKTSSSVKEKTSIDNYFLQAAAYSIMTKERYGITMEQLCIAITTEHEGLQVFIEPLAKWERRLRTFLNYLKKAA